MKSKFVLSEDFITKLHDRLERERLNSHDAGKPPETSIIAAKRKSPDSNPYGPHTLPDVVTLRSLVEEAFWASIEREEGQPARFTVGYLPPTDDDYILTFEKTHPYVIREIVKLSPAVKDNRAAMFVHQGENGGLHIWGMSDFSLAQLRVSVLDPGRILVGYGKRNVALISGSACSLIDENVYDRTKTLWKKILKGDEKLRKEDVEELITNILREMRSAGRGGSLLFVDPGSAWINGIVSIKYKGTGPLKSLGDLGREWGSLATTRSEKGLGNIGGGLNKLGRMAVLLQEFNRLPGSVAEMSDVDWRNNSELRPGGNWIRSEDKIRSPFRRKGINSKDRYTR